VFTKSGRSQKNVYTNIANVSKTIRKPPLSEAQTALGKQKYGEERFLPQDAMPSPP